MTFGTPPQHGWPQPPMHQAGQPPVHTAGQQPPQQPQPQQGRYPLHPSLQAGGYSFGSQQLADDVPWIVGTRLAPGQQIKRSVLWGVIALSLTALHLIAAAVGLMQLVMVDPFGFRATLPVWGVLSLLLLASIIMCFIKRGTFNIVSGSIAAFTLVVSNPVIPLGFIAMLGG